MRRLFTLAFALVLSPLMAYAQPLFDHVPDDAIVYVGWRGTQNMGEAYEQSHLKAIIDSSDWDEFFTTFLPAVLEKVGQNDRDAAKAADLFTAIAKPLLNHSGAFYFRGLDFANPRRPVPMFAVHCDAGADAPALVAALKDALANAPQGGKEQRPVVSEANGIVTLSVGPQNATAKSLSTVPGYQAIATTAHSKPVSIVYVDGERLLTHVDQAVAAAGGPEGVDRWNSVRDAAGLAGFKRAMYTGGFDGKGWTTFTSIEAPAPRTGLLQFLDNKPITDEIIQTIPATAVMAAAGRFDFTRLLDGIREGGSKVDPEFAQNYGAVMGYIGGMIGVELPTLVEPLGDQWSYFVDPTVGGDSVAGVVLVNKLDDPVKARDLFAKAEQGINRTLQRQLPREMSIQIKQAKRGDLDIHYLATPIMTPAWAIDGDKWYFGLYPQVVASAVAQARTKGPSIATNPAYTAVREQLGSNAASSISFVDVPKLANGNYPIWLMLSRYAGFGDIFGIDSPLMLMPPLHELMPHLTPAGSVAWSDEKGWYSRSVSSFPGARMLAGDPSTSVAAPTAVLVGVLLPSLNRARETANRVKSGSNLRQIGQACLLFSNENRGKYPPDLGSVMLTQDVPISVFVSPRTDTVIPPEIQQADPPTQAEWINVNSDYVYKGGGMNVNAHPESVVAYERPDGLDDGVNVLFGDGHVEFVPMERAMAMIAK